MPLARSSPSTRNTPSNVPHLSMTQWDVVLLGISLAAAAAAQTLPAGYVGSEICNVCHEDIYNGIAKSAHHAVDTDAKRGWQGRACESCHGPGQKHAESGDASLIRNPANLTAAATDQICLTCHLNQPTQVGRLESSHARNQVACTACHKVHESQRLVVRKAEATNKLCASCHLNQWAQFQRPFHHKLPEGDMSCVDCHNPHGSILPAMLQTFAANEPGCFKCHGDKRGPFTFEHAPVRFEGCQACHEPHGSANPRMLIRANVRFVCLECHANLPNAPVKVMGVVPPAFHDLRSPVFQNCTVCHQKIHGSHVDRNLLK
jgi:DmsE family decaheme c-type cytochrome